jgi:flap endonuclease-1
VLVYEAPLIRNFTNKVGPLQIISGAEVRSCLGLERESYVDFNLLLGTDFSQRLKNVGPARAFKFISEHKSIERVLETETQYPPRTSQDIYLEQVATARTVFNTFPPLPEPLDLQFKQPDVNRVEQILRKYSVHQRDYSWENPKSLGDGYFGDNPSLMEGDFAFEPFR